MFSYVKTLTQWLHLDHVSGEIQPQPEPPEQLYHIILTVSHLAKDPNSQLEKLRVVGTYVSLPVAKAAAYRVLFEAGYESEMFTEYETDSHSGSVSSKRMVSGVLVHAETQDGTAFEVSILGTPNDLKMMTLSEDGRVLHSLYHVMQTDISYEDYASNREHKLKGSFHNYEDASKRAMQVLLDGKDGLTKESYAQYDEAAPGEKDCGYGENVLVHAVGNDGENILISVVLGQVLESARLAEAAMRIR